MIATRLLFLLLFARLLMPPGMCICKYEAPAVKALAWVFGQEAPPVPGEPDDHDHHPGCPASFLSTGLGLTPAAGPVVDLAADLPALIVGTDLVGRPSAELPPPSVSLPPPEPPLFLSHCALLV